MLTCCTVMVLPQTTANALLFRARVEMFRQDHPAVKQLVNIVILMLLNSDQNSNYMLHDICRHGLYEVTELLLAACVFGFDAR